MSRHQIAGLNPRHTVFVGWDPPLRSYFGQVYDPTKAEDENPVLWVGADRPQQLRAIHDLAEAMSGFAELDAPTIRRLFQDRELDR